MLLVAVLAGIGAARPAVAGSGPWRYDVLPLAAALESVQAALLIALWLIAWRRPKPGYLGGLLRAGLLRTILLGMATVAVLAALSRLNIPLGRGRIIRPGTPTQPPQPAPGPVKKGAAAHSAASLTYAVYALLALLLLAAIVACILLLLRRVPTGPVGEMLELSDDDDAGMRDAIESGRRALRSFDDAQAAIIACYVAMEASLASAGATRGAAETPDELLARAVGSGLLHGAAAGQLTALFYEARYSSHPLPATARDEAVRALDAISAELALRDEGRRLSGTATQGTAP